LRKYDEQNRIVLDLDRDRLRTVLRESYKICRDTLAVEPLILEDRFVAKLEPYLESNRVTTLVTLALPIPGHEEAILELDLRKRSAMIRMANRKLQARLNHLIGIL
jgi:hypothetical protein